MTVVKSFVSFSTSFDFILSPELLCYKRIVIFGPPARVAYIKRVNIIIHNYCLVRILKERDTIYEIGFI